MSAPSPPGARLFGTTSVYLAGNLFNASVPFLLIPVLTRAFEPADYGVVAMFGILVSVFSAFTGLSLGAAVNVRYFKLPADELARFVGAAFQVLGGATLLTAVTVLLLAPFLTSTTSLSVPWLLAAVLVSSAQGLVAVRLALWQAQQRALRYVLLQGGQALLNGALSLAFVLGLSMGWTGRAYAQTIAASSAAVAALLLFRSREVARPIDRAHARDALAFGLPLVPHLLGGLALAAADRIVIASALGLGEAGVYTAALQLGMVLGIGTDALNRAYAPWLLDALRRTDPERDARLVRSTYVYFSFLGIAATLMGLGAPHLMGVLVGPSFRAAAPVVVYIAWGFAFGGMYYMVTNYVFFAGRTGSLAGVSLTAGAVNLALTWWWVRVDGVVGAGRAFVVSQAVLFLGTWALAQTAHPMPWLSALRRRGG